MAAIVHRTCGLLAWDIPPTWSPTRRLARSRTLWEAFDEVAESLQHYQALGCGGKPHLLEVPGVRMRDEDRVQPRLQCRDDVRTRRVPDHPGAVGTETVPLHQHPVV